MKNFYLILIVTVALSACTSQNYYQLLETQATNSSYESAMVVFNNDDIVISYNFWGNNGNGSFSVTNNSSRDIFIDLKRSHLIINGVANTYFQNRNFSNKKTSFFSPATDEVILDQQSIKLPGVPPKSASVQADESVIFYEERVICIPPLSTQIIYGFNMLEEIFRDCNLYRFPSNKQIVSSDFSEQTSPYKYRNRITYSFDEEFTNPISLENEFFVNKITNYPENEFVKYESIKFCNDSSGFTTKVYPFAKPSSFFIKYKLEPGRIDH